MTMNRKRRNAERLQKSFKGAASSSVQSVVYSDVKVGDYYVKKDSFEEDI